MIQIDDAYWIRVFSSVTLPEYIRWSLTDGRRVVNDTEAIEGIVIERSYSMAKRMLFKITEEEK